MAVVVPFIGAAIGNAAISGTILGLSGGAFGWLAGSLLSSLIFKPPGQQGPRLEDLTIVGTDYGQAIPWVAGSPRLAPQYAWVSPLREIANTQKVGKGGGQKVTTYTYECDVLLILTENVTEGAARDWVNAELVRNGLTTKSGLWSSVAVYTGEDDQLPDPVYEAAVGTGNAPAYRGKTTIRISGLQLGGGKSLPNIEHQITKSTSVIDDRIVLLTNFEDGSSEDQSSYAIGPGTQNGGTLVDGEYQVNLNSGTNTLVWSNAALTIPPGTPFTFEYIFNYPSSNPSVVSSAPVAGFNLGYTASTYQHSVSGIAAPSVPVSSWFQVAPLGGLNPLTHDTLTDAETGFDIHIAIVFHGDGYASIFYDGVRVVNRVSVTNYGSPAGNGSVTLGSSFLTLNKTYTIKGVRAAKANVYDAASFTPPDTLTGSLDNVEVTISQGAVALDEVLEGLMLRAGYSAGEFDIDSELAAKEMFGYATANVTSTRAHLETLRPFGLYECNCSDKIYIFPRATDPVGVIPWSDLGVSETPGDPSDPFPLQMGNEVEVPAQIAVRYRNVAADWNTGTEMSDRMLSSLVSTQNAEMPFGLLPEQAKAIADTMLKDAIAGLGRAALRVGGRKHAKYEPGDVLTTTAPNGTAYRFRIINKRDHIFMLEWDVALDDASALDSPAITETGYISTEDPLRVAPTDWEVLALRPLRDSDATTPGAYVAVTPAKDADSDEWPGAVFVRSRLPGAFEQEFISGDACVIGECLTTLGDFPPGSTVFDTTQTLRVKVRGELESSNWADFFQDRTVNAAVVGNEPIRFLTATFVQNDGQFKVYDITSIMRGQLGFEAEIAGHTSGERFVLLNNSIRRMVNETPDIGQEHEVKAVTLNQLLDEVAEVPFTDTGIALKPLSPVHLLALANVGGDLDVTFVRRSRLVARFTDTGCFTPLGEATEAYVLRVYNDPDTDPVRTVPLTTTAWTYEAADIASDGFTTGDPITITVTQVSDAVGEGDAATLEVEAP